MTFYEVISAAVRDFSENGYDSEDRLEVWLERIRQAAAEEMVSEAEVQAQLRDALQTIYTRLVERGQLLQRNPGIGRFTLERVKPQLRLELDRRILASANLIKLNRRAAIESTLQRFSGWATSIPPGGTPPGDRQAAAKGIRRDMAQIKFRDRRVAIDQSHKFMANLSEILAADSGALAGEWHQHHTNNPRITHTERDGKVYLVRDSWAHRRKLVKPGPDGYTDEITKPGEEVYCRCTYRWIFALRGLPSDMVTKAGADELARVRSLAA